MCNNIYEWKVGSVTGGFFFFWNIINYKTWKKSVLSYFFFRSNLKVNSTTWCVTKPPLIKICCWLPLVWGTSINVKMWFQFGFSVSFGQLLWRCLWAVNKPSTTRVRKSTRTGVTTDSIEENGGRKRFPSGWLPFLWRTSDSTSVWSFLNCWSADSTSCSFSSNHCGRKIGWWR